jgi:hypothetical protein
LACRYYSCSIDLQALTTFKACTGGDYYFNRYELRGKIITDSEGYFEVLSVTPGAYLGRAGHFHYIVTPPTSDSNKYEEMTTQSYICIANDKKGMDTDLSVLDCSRSMVILTVQSVNWLFMRSPPYNRMITSWSIPEATGGKPVGNFPVLSDVVIDAEARDRVNSQIKQWNERLAALEDYKGEDLLKVVAGGYAESRLSPKGGLGLW